ncbi:MAG: AI-2E family transporter [Prochloraceae cyanobacterium]|nr:AI-2E family transporter [Prochloraceae cyanobacterium]
MESNFRVVNLVIRLFFLGLLSAWCFILLRPLIGIFMWGIILAIVSFPLFVWLKARLGGRAKLAGAIVILLGFAIVVGPVSIIAQVFISNAESFADSLASGTLAVPPPPEGISAWPLIGKPLYEIWQSASVNLGDVLSKFKQPLEELAKNLLLLAGNTGLNLLQFLLSIIIAGVLMLKEEGLTLWVTRLFLKLTPKQGQAFVKLAAATVRSVTRGIIGVSLLQSLLIGIGFTVAGIPAAGLLSLLCLILAIIQIGPGLVVIPTLIFAWSTMNTLGALLFTIWMLPAMLVDNVLKPILMARGLPVPMVVILTGVLGGTLAHGILGLFVGPVILSLGYELLRAWINEDLATASIPADREQ